MLMTHTKQKTNYRNRLIENKNISPENKIEWDSPHVIGPTQLLYT